MICVRCQVVGRVQGVFYRASTQSQAQSLGLSGYVKNLSNGQVEVLACGDSSRVERLLEWLWQGPQLAEVSDVQCEPIDLDAVPTGFTID